MRVCIKVVVQSYWKANYQWEWGQVAPEGPVCAQGAQKQWNRVKAAPYRMETILTMSWLWDNRNTEKSSQKTLREIQALIKNITALKASFSSHIWNRSLLLSHLWLKEVKHICPMLTDTARYWMLIFFYLYPVNALLSSVALQTLSS